MKKKLSDLDIIIITGQIMSRVTTKNNEDEAFESRKVVIPKSITSDGSITMEVLPEEQVRTTLDPKKITNEGDIVIKLSTPYDAAIVGEESAGCVVPSFCAIIKNQSELDTRYLLAYLNSESCKEQLAAQVAGAVMTVLSVGKIKNVVIPIPSREKQNEIATAYTEAQIKIKTIRRIMELEAKRNDALFAELMEEE